MCVFSFSSPPFQKKRRIGRPCLPAGNLQSEISRSFRAGGSAAMDMNMSNMTMPNMTMPPMEPVGHLPFFLKKVSVVLLSLEVTGFQGQLISQLAQYLSGSSRLQAETNLPCTFGRRAQKLGSVRCVNSSAWFPPAKLNNFVSRAIR